ncbi:MAG: T9SS type A sorting domain-containing protein [Candidatus Kapabacteria bacterium]|nr:T9SS type A sorting domain-containing protein [Candidatus Kapabacteria bacterium]
MKLSYIFSIFAVIFLLLYAIQSNSYAQDFTLSSASLTIELNKIDTLRPVIENISSKKLLIYAVYVVNDDAVVGADLHAFEVLDNYFELDKKGESNSKREIRILYTSYTPFQGEFSLIVLTSSIEQPEIKSKITINIASDVENDVQYADLKIFPNPASEYIEIAVDINPTVNRRVDEGSEIRIFNTLGECVMTVETRHVVSLPRIDISHLPRGIYYIRIGTHTQIFVKSEL